MYRAERRTTLVSALFFPFVKSIGIRLGDNPTLGAVMLTCPGAPPSLERQLEAAHEFMIAAKAAILTLEPRSPWHPFFDARPVRVGVYETRSAHSPQDPVRRMHWNGSCWRSVDGRADVFGSFAGDEWRGLAREIRE